MRQVVSYAINVRNDTRAGNRQCLSLNKTRSVKTHKNGKYKYTVIEDCIPLSTIIVMFNSHRAKDNSTLSISSPHISDCREVAEYMRKSGILCHVSPNYTVAHATITDDSESPPTNNNRYAIETGCQIKFGEHSPHFQSHTHPHTTTTKPQNAPLLW